MIFDPSMLSRLLDGDDTALDSSVEFDDGEVMTLRDCGPTELAVMNAWMKYKAADSDRMLATLDKVIDARRREHIRVVD